MNGFWKLVGGNQVNLNVYECSNCKRKIDTFKDDNVEQKFPYCHCGAKMSIKEG